MAKHLIPFDTFGDLARFEPLRSFEDFFRGFGLDQLRREFDATSLIRLDVHESDTAYTVKAELPGMKKEDIKVAIDGDRVSISAESARTSERKEGDTVVRSERHEGALFRSMTLPHEIDDEKAVAAFHDGLLELTLPKKPSQGVRHLTIK